MRILFFLESLHGGGKERRSVELIRYLREQAINYEIELVLTEEEIYYEDIYKAGVNIRILKRKRFKYDPGIFLKFYRICKAFKPDLIHTFGKMATFYAIPAKLAIRIPLISNLISDSYKSYNSFSRYSFFLKTNVFFSDIILSNSQAGLRAYNIRGKRARVIYNGVRLSRFHQEFDPVSVRKELNIVTKFLVIMVASFSDFKDYDLFIDAAREMAFIRNDVTFLGVGDGPQWNRIRSRVDKEGINNVVLTGRMKGVEQLIAASDIGILCTFSEGISNSIIEYMALGKPVISTDQTGGSRELMTDGITGYCTERKPGKIVELINKLVDNPELRIKMGNAGKQRIGTSFSIEKMGMEFQSLYKEILESGSYGRASLKEKNQG